MEFNYKANKFLMSRGFHELPKYMVDHQKPAELILDKLSTEYPEGKAGDIYKILHKYIEMMPHSEFVLLHPLKQSAVFMVKEIKDGIIVTVLNIMNKSFITKDFSFTINKETNDEDNCTLLIYILGFIEMLNNKEYRTGTKRISLPNKNKKGYKRPVSSEFTYISNVRYLKQKSFNTGDGIKWEHGWQVRGHWRRVTDNTIGKDRNGIRCSLGRTWINPCIKNSNLPMKNNIRIMK